MGSIINRQNARGVTYRAQIVIREKGVTLHQESRSFDKRALARAWMERREAELRAPGGIDAASGKAKARTITELVEDYLRDMGDRIGKTKAQVLRSIVKEYPISDMAASELRSEDVLEFARQLSVGRDPSTVQNYLSHLSGVLGDARAAHGVDVDIQAVADGMKSARRRGLAGKSRQRTRRPTLKELDKIMVHFESASITDPRCIPMHLIVAFAIFSARRQEEITRITWSDFDERNGLQLVRDMKNPGQKVGNDVWCEVTPEAIRIMNVAKDLLGDEGRIFSFNSDTISRRFTDACKILGIEDLHFHDLRHEAASRLFEMGRTIPQVASVTGHRSWQSLQRYAHLQAVGDRLENWKWLDRIEKSLTPDSRVRDGSEAQIG